MQIALEPTETMSREEWLQKRRSGISGTDIAGILGKSPWATPVSVYLDKAGLAAPSLETPVQKRGKRMESTVAAIYEEEMGFRLVDPGFLRHAEHEWIIGNPDRVALSGPIAETLGVLGVRPSWSHGLEIKTAHWSTKDHWGEPGTDEVPMHYLLQVNWYMLVTGLPFFDLWGMFSLDDIRTYRIHRDTELESILIAKAEAFWRRHVLAGVMPELDGSDAASNYLAHKFPRNVEPLLEAPEGALELARRAREAQERKSQAEYEEKEYKNRLKELIGEAEGFTFGALGKVTWKKEKDSMGTSWEQVAKDLHQSLVEHVKRSEPGALPMAEALLDALTKKNQVVTRHGARKLLLSLKDIDA